MARPHLHMELCPLKYDNPPKNSCAVHDHDCRMINTFTETRIPRKIVPPSILRELKYEQFTEQAFGGPVEHYIARSVDVVVKLDEKYTVTIPGIVRDERDGDWFVIPPQLLTGALDQKYGSGWMYNFGAPNNGMGLANPNTNEQILLSGGGNLRFNRAQFKVYA